MKRKSKLVVGLLIITMLVLTVSTTVSASVYTPKDFEESGYIQTTGTGADNVKSVGGKIVGLIRVVGTIVAVGMIIVLGIKYMMGSAEERAEYKKTLFPYFIGAVLIFAATSLTDVIYQWASNL